MKDSTRNPTRRNRNIGTAKSGLSKNNSLVVPEKWVDAKIFWERLVDPVFVQLSVSGHIITLAIEPVRPGYVHAVTPQDINRLLQLVPIEHLEEINLIVLRQPKRKEEILKPVWGRFVYWADLGRYTGPAIYLEALPVGHTLKWGKSLTPFNQKELDALTQDGHTVTKVRRGFDIHTTPLSVRNTQLWRTLPHEFGHAVDFLVNSLNPSCEADSETESDYVRRVFSSKPSLDKEEFANRYAKEFRQTWTKTGQLPFPVEFDPEFLTHAGLDPRWFYDGRGA